MAFASITWLAALAIGRSYLSVIADRFGCCSMLQWFLVELATQLVHNTSATHKSKVRQKAPAVLAALEIPILAK